MATIRNPQNGRKVKLGGSLYKKLLREGILQPLGTVPDIQNFIYLSENDTWIRKNSQKYKLCIETYGLIIHNDMLVPKTKYNTSESLLDQKIDRKIAKKIYQCYDILGLILRMASSCISTYCCLRSTSKRFCSILETVAAYESILVSVTETGTRIIRSVFSIPPNALELYMHSYPTLIINSFLISHLKKRELVAIKGILVKRLQENDEFRIIAKEYLLSTIIPTYRLNYDCYTLDPFLQYLTFTNEEGSVRISVLTPLFTEKLTSATRGKFSITQLQEFQKQQGPPYQKALIY